MSYRLAIVIVAAGCASASNEPREAVDGPDAAVATVDAPPEMIDAAPCMATAMTQLLVNPAFDAMPPGMGWTEAPVNATYPIVTTDDGIAEQSPSMKAWMGGYAQADANDQLYQDVAIPNGTASLVMKGFYAVATTETATIAKDTGTLQLTETTGAVLDAVASYDNTMTTTTWAPIDRTVPNAAALSGKTVRVIFKTSNDATAHTNFFFDSLTLTATHCP